MPVVQGGITIQKNVRSSDFSIFFMKWRWPELENESTEEGINKEVYRGRLPNTRTSSHGSELVRGRIGVHGPISIWF